jgi:glucose/arabinose dehydrogenase
MLTALSLGDAAPNALQRSQRELKLSSGETLRLNVPNALDMRIAADGMNRTRFMARSPDGRLFVTDMFDKTDNKKGAVYAFKGFDAASGKLSGRVTYLSNLRNPNSLTFHTDKAGRDWLYLALTDKLVRYRFTKGETKPSSAPQTLATFPDFGLGYKYGGWHLTRTVVVGPDERVYVSVGSSCNACVEKEAVRASVIVMNLDGSGQRPFATGLRNAVGLKFLRRTLYASNMGADHLGDDRPNDQLYALQDGKNYGWPYCYVNGKRAVTDPKYNPGGKSKNCSNVPLAVAGLPPHGAPLGLEFFQGNTLVSSSDAFLVALHGSGFIRIGAGYAVWRVRQDGSMEPFIDGFLRGSKIFGRPVDVLKWGVGFLLTDDYAGAIYYVSRK